jgi:hypothetical protein
MKENEKLTLEIVADSDSVLIRASKPNYYTAIDIPCSDTQCLAKMQEFLTQFDETEVEVG